MWGLWVLSVLCSRTLVHCAGVVRTRAVQLPMHSSHLHIEHLSRPSLTRHSPRAPCSGRHVTYVTQTFYKCLKTMSSLCSVWGGPDLLLRRTRDVGHQMNMEILFPSELRLFLFLWWEPRSPSTGAVAGQEHGLSNSPSTILPKPTHNGESRWSLIT